MPEPREIRIISLPGDPVWAAGRTLRSLPAAPSGGRWRIRAGAWLPRRAPEWSHPSEDEPCILIGCTLIPGTRTPEQPWLDLLHANGGIFRTGDSPALPPVCSMWMNDAAEGLCEGGEDDLQGIVLQALANNWRVYRHGPLDVCHDPQLRVLQILTSLQRGGAERLALDLHHALPRHRLSVSLLTLGSPGREPFATPVNTVQLRLPPDPVIRAAEIDQVIRHLGTDVAHAHLVDGETLARLPSDVPLAVTIHNQRQGWPAGMDRLQTRQGALLIGCSEVVAGEIAAAFPHHAARTIWNGIQPSPPPATPALPRPLTLISVANPRPQKRLPLLIDILAAMPGARLKIAGQPSAIHADAQNEVRLCEEKIAAYGLGDAVDWLGSVQDVATVLAQTDVFVSTSLHEGMSLAQLEAIAAGVPVIATDVSGTAEIAARHPQMMRRLPVDAPPETFATAIREIAAQRGKGTLSVDFTTPTMAARHAWLLQALLIPRAAPRRGLLLITNNFSTGGAQSSARRLLIQLRQMGEHVRAVVLQEHPHHPTPGVQTLRQESIDVLALDPPDVCDAQTALIPLLHYLAASPPESVVFWNVIPEYKVLLADALWGFPVFDVSPGEMYFASLERYFTNLRPGLPYLNPSTYGQRLAAVIVKHESELEQASRVLGCPAHLISNGVQIRPHKLEPPGAGWTLGTAARLHPHKRLEDLIDAFRIVHARYPHARLRIAGAADAGQDAYAASLRQSTANLPVEWCGELTDLSTFHDTLCLFAMISEPSGCPNASLEAMASSLPVVATAVGGARQQVEHGITGLLTPPRDAPALAAALIELLGDPARRSHMRASAHARATESFRVETMAKNYRRLCLPA